MRKSFFQKFFLCFLFSMVAFGSFAGEMNWSSAPENARKIFTLAHKDLVAVDTANDWVFVPGEPRNGWAGEKTAGEVFRLKGALIDLRALLPEYGKKISEGVLYYEFTSPQDGVTQLGMGCDWYFEARCNGILCYSTMDSGNNTNRFSPANHPFFFPVKKGKNLLAVHTRSGSIGWTFACGAVPFTLPQLPVLRRRPVLMWPDKDSISICFQTCGKIGAGVEYKEKNAGKWTLLWDHKHGQIIRRDFHTVNLAGLQPGAEYVYRAVMIDRIEPQIWYRSDEFTFRMPERDTEKFSFFFTADLQYEYGVQQTLLRNLLQAAGAEDCDFMVLGGDIGMSFDPDNVVDNLLPLFPPQKPVVYLRGNHELRGTETERYYDYFAMPNGRSYGLFRFGGTAFMVLDSWEDKPAESKGAWYCKYNVDGEFYKEELEYVKPLFQSPEWVGAGRRIVLCHSAPYAHAGKYIPQFLKRLTDDDLGGRNPKSRISLWVSGHKHFHMRAIPGTNEIAAPDKPSCPEFGGKNYVYPVITVAGPTKSSPIKASAYRVDGDEKGIRVRAWSDDGTLLEDVSFAKDGRFTAVKEMKRYTVEPSCKQ